MTLTNLLAIDIGNTNIHLGLWQGESWALSWRARTVADKMPDEYAVLVRNFLNSTDVNYQQITGVVMCSVVPPITSAFIELVRRYFNQEPLNVTSKTNIGVRLEIDQPEQAGPDRIVNAAAVVAQWGGPAIVVDFGTATTFDVISRDNAYLGGAICPGIRVAHDALVSRAARLHKVDLEPPPHPVGRNTIHAMQSGLFWGYIGLIEGLITRLKADMGEQSARVIGTGGLAPLFREHTSAIQQIESELTLDGLRLIYALNHS